jgi:hypothetical protein
MPTVDSDKVVCGGINAMTVVVLVNLDYFTISRSFNILLISLSEFSLIEIMTSLLLFYVNSL